MENYQPESIFLYWLPLEIRLLMYEYVFQDHTFTKVYFFQSYLPMTHHPRFSGFKSHLCYFLSSGNLPYTGTFTNLSRSLPRRVTDRHRFSFPSSTGTSGSMDYVHEFIQISSSIPCESVWQHMPSHGSLGLWRYCSLDRLEALLYGNRHRIVAAALGYDS